MAQQKRPLFVYAKLKKANKPDNVAAHGELRRRPDGDGAAHFSAKAPGLVHGQILDPALDTTGLGAIERPEYVRRKIVLTDGTLADAYEYARKDWDKLPVIESGTWDKR